MNNRRHLQSEESAMNVIRPSTPSLLSTTKSLPTVTRKRSYSNAPSQRAFYHRINVLQSTTASARISRFTAKVIAWTSHSCVVALIFSMGLFTCALCILTALVAAPIVTTCVIICLLLAIFFVVTESRSWGRWLWASRESESRFWCMTSVIFSSALLFAPDSPISVGRHYPFLGICIVVATAIYVNHYDRKLNRLELIRPPHLRRVSSVVLIDQVNSKAKLKVIQDCLDAIDVRFIALKAINQSEIIRREKEILSILEECTDEELNFFVTNINLSLLLYKIKDRDVMAWSKNSLQHRTRILRLLCETRLSALRTSAKVSLIDALMNLRLTAHHEAEVAVCNILCKTSGRALTRLKTACDAKGTATNLHKLIFKDVQDPDLRRRILEHIQAEGNLIMNDRYGYRVKILSDVDDTLFSSGGRFPAGVDKRYGRHVLYPGVLSFLKELDLGPEAVSGDWTSGRLGNLVFLSARPHVYKDKAESRSYLQFEELRLRKGIPLHCVPTLLAGTLDSGFQMMWRGTFAAIASTKAINFGQYAQLYPEFNFIFLGDNGQGDVLAAELVKAQLGDKLRSVFIHAVQPKELTPGYTVESMSKWQKLGIHFYRTYIGAAILAARGGFIHPLGLQRIAQHACTDWMELKPTLDPHNAGIRREELNKDLKLANTLLVERGYAPVPHLPAERVFAIHSLVVTPFGIGEVRGFDPIHARYTVALIHWILRWGAEAFAYLPESKLKYAYHMHVGCRVWTPYGMGILQEIRATDAFHVVALTSWGYPLPHPPAPPLAYLHSSNLCEIVAIRGESVQTNYGIGVVLNFRPEDEIYTIRIKCGQTGNSFMTLYCRATDMTRIEPGAPNGGLRRSPCVIM